MITISTWILCQHRTLKFHPMLTMQIPYQLCYHHPSQFLQEVENLRLSIDWRDSLLGKRDFEKREKGKQDPFPNLASFKKLILLFLQELKWTKLVMSQSLLLGKPSWDELLSAEVSRAKLSFSQKMSLVKVAWYMLRVKNMHPGSPSDSWGLQGKVKPSYVHYIIRWGEAKLRMLKLTSVFHHFPSVGSKQLCVLADLGFTRTAGSSQYIISLYF